MPWCLSYANLRQRNWLNQIEAEHTRIFLAVGARTMRYRVLPCSSVKRRISLHKNARNLRPLLALLRNPSLSNLRSPKCRVGAIRSSCLKNLMVSTRISAPAVSGTHPWPIHRYCESVLSLLRPSCSRIASLMVSNILSAVCSARSVNTLSWSGSVYCRICLMSSGYRVMRCTAK